jgi:hypothetical protein
LGRNARCTNSSLDGVQYAIHDGTNAPCIAARKGQGNRLLKRFAGLWHAQQNDLDAIVLRSVIG